MLTPAENGWVEHDRWAEAEVGEAEMQRSAKDEEREGDMLGGVRWDRVGSRRAGWVAERQVWRGLTVQRGSGGVHGRAFATKWLVNLRDAVAWDVWLEFLGPRALVGSYGKAAAGVHLEVAVGFSADVFMGQQQGVINKTGGRAGTQCSMLSSRSLHGPTPGGTPCLFTAATKAHPSAMPARSSCTSCP